MRGRTEVEMAGKGSGLAARFRRALMSEAEARRQEKLEEARRKEEAQKAREALFEDLAAFGAETGFLRVQRHADGVSLRWQKKHLHFETDGDEGRIKVRFEGMGETAHALYREAQLEHRWVWVAGRGPRQVRQLFFDQGLEELLVLALGLPRPAEPDPEGGAGSVSKRL